jgi:hypothetical protein
MAGSDLRNLTARLQRVHIREEIVEGDQRELVGRQVDVVVAPVQVQRNIEASTAGRSPLPIETPFILSPLVASRLGTQRLSEPGTKVLGPRSIDYWGRGGGLPLYSNIEDRASRLYFTKGIRSWICAF